MGLLSGLLGHASEVDIDSVEKDLERIMADGERVEKAYRVVRDLFIFTDRRLVLVDKQGMTGRKVEYHSIPYKSISHFSVETTGTFDLEAELKIYISSAQTPIQKTFRKSTAIYDVQKALATYGAR